MAAPTRSACRSTTIDVPASEPGADVLAIDSALEMLAAEDPRKAQVVELRFFGGLSIDETAEALGVSVRTVHADWAFARAWLYRALTRPMPTDRWLRLDEIFAEAIDAAGRPRAEFLARRCGRRRHPADELAALVAAEARLGRFSLAASARRLRAPGFPRRVVRPARRPYRRLHRRAAPGRWRHG